MKARSVWAALVTAFASALDVAGQAPVISSFAGNGRLVWTNGVNTNAIYRVEWASQAGGPWHSFTYQPVNSVDAHGQTAFETDMPMFFRVVMETNPPPAGMVWVDGGPFAMGCAIVGVAEPDEAPVHTNCVSGFWMDATEVTGLLWASVYAWATNNGYGFNGTGCGRPEATRCTP